MNYPHRLEKELHSEFLKQGRIDPITGELIEEGHTIVICAACKSAFFIESWEYLGEIHCNQAETLTDIPKPKKLFLEAKPLEYLPFLFKKGNQDFDNTIHSLSENAITGILVLIFMTLLTFLAILVGSLTSPLVALMFVIGLIGATAYYLNKKKSTTFLNRKINPNRATHIALDMKKQGITIKKKTDKRTFNFDDIKEINYFIEYVAHTGRGDYNMCALSLQFVSFKNKTKNRTKTTTYYTLLDVNEIPYWSEFLEQLPYSLKVLNIK
ncbi:hypothetical protein V9L05_10420 [Bernardetia sp. Wsw4-3y2]|uniref:hypothetical protein n=1 Tax=Bernardetia sp. Wsw4-3y2 TaxID=3127471 RepID=UPI0030D28D40